MKPVFFTPRPSRYAGLIVMGRCAKLVDGALTYRLWLGDPDIGQETCALTVSKATYERVALGDSFA